MLRVIIAAVLMLSMAVMLTAQYGAISREEFSRRHGELRAQAEQIKQETRFDGEIIVTPEINRISHFRGNFEGIRVPAIDDTLGFERVFDEILDRVLPHFPVNRRDLTKEPVRISRVSTAIHYKQTANGYEIELSPRLIIYYLPDQEIFVINNGLAYLDPAQLPTEPVITEEEAIRIYFENVEIYLEQPEIPEYRKHHYPDFSKPRFKLMYSSQETGLIGPYRLCWIGGGGGSDRRLTIDALTGTIIANYSSIR